MRGEGEEEEERERDLLVSSLEKRFRDWHE